MPIEQKQAVYSMNYTNCLLLAVLAQHLNQTPQQVASFLAAQLLSEQSTVTEDEINQFMQKFAELAKRMPAEGFIFESLDKERSDER
ncbi:MAG: hypothetical protein JGK17_28385 [Microcoleus sp. PH2017_10_PVI_O_A]|nr:hypothetical protein [Microcoleus sp. PH2017_10_PVI_O_A]MCC3463654.1 hypothetical protein [Microcoleus sp. PH2017_11_PCY_U_A]MCC3482018.1 hypothetical protein [Microcoleus sp. PH2017_12_PCY_D_A]MCC3562983.1 hypothetical protein [Microcoleus sp. PH2017_27_LUM_O_A]